MSEFSSDEDQQFMEELKQEFRETAARNMVELDRLIRAEDLAEIARIAHDIKGTSGIFGFDEGTEIARELNIAAKNGEVEETRVLIQKLNTYMKRENIIR
ncbi:MAG: Hpt domain-containing protein [bacterium]|nr:Hpt domain-containing protein [bacterium]